MIFLSGLTAQPATVLHHDRPYHATGEVSWFRAYLPAPAPPTVRVEVYAPDGSRLDYFFLKSDVAGGTAEGYYRWGYDLPTGYYRIALTALSAAGEDVPLGTFRHPVYRVDDRNATAEAATNDAAEFATDDLDLRVEGDALRIAGAPAGTYSVAVYHDAVVGSAAGATVSSAPAQPTPACLDTLFYRGQILAATDAAPVNVNLLPVFDGATYATYFSKTDAAGEFLLNLPAFAGSKTVQVRSITDQALKGSLSSPRLPRLEQRPPLTAEVIEYLDLSHRRRKIYQLYRTVETPLEVEVRPERPLPLRASKSYNVQDYKAFPDLYTFFREVAGELRFRERRDGYTAQLYNAPTQRFFTGTPLFIVDGRLTRDADYVARLDPADVARVSFYYGNRELREQFPALGSQGVVQIDRLRPAADLPADDAANLLELHGLQPALNFTPRSGEEVPRLSPLLLWQTGTTEGEQTLIPLPATDDSGTFRVVVLLRTAAGDALLGGTTTFTREPGR
ncbi:hypothetical protein CGL56_13945 [Neolewinella marina]|uniref:Uncharacterized protein n=1 Tax=Neolewinella marina TaxID=438751 RepID=A0A2G0CD56_9BACT|nr:hypothetical protein CGL56_13945 [Neolewinella marina]